MEEIISVGDSGNDIAMTKALGVGLSTSNSSEKLKQVADKIICSNQEHIVAYYNQVGDTLRFMDAAIYTVNANNIQNVVKNANYDVTKVFLWEDLEKISPLTEAETIQ